MTYLQNKHSVVLASPCGDQYLAYQRSKNKIIDHHHHQHHYQFFSSTLTKSFSIHPYIQFKYNLYIFNLLIFSICLSKKNSKKLSTACYVFWENFRSFFFPETSLYLQCQFLVAYLRISYNINFQLYSVFNLRFKAVS